MPSMRSDSSGRPDPRRNAWRQDLAADSLRGIVDAPRYAEGAIRQLLRPHIAMRRRPDPKLSFDNEVLFGELVTVYDERDGWSWIQLMRDGYVGYVPSDGLAPAGKPATHRVQALGTFIYPAADIKAPPIMPLSLNARVTVVGSDDRFSEIATGGYIISRHLSELTKPARDFVEVVERFLGVPYLWGGRSRLGLDCSGLLQLGLEAAGIHAPRDSDMQQAELGTDMLIPKDLDGLQRGDLVFWPGHVGIMSDAVMMVHANAHHMAVAIEPLEVAARRIERTGSKIAAIKRLPVDLPRTA